LACCIILKSRIGITRLVPTRAQSPPHARNASAQALGTLKLQSPDKAARGVGKRGSVPRSAWRRRLPLSRGSGRPRPLRQWSQRSERRRGLPRRSSSSQSLRSTHYHSPARRDLRLGEAEDASGDSQNSARREEGRGACGGGSTASNHQEDGDKGAAQSLPSEEEGRQLSFFPSEPLAF
jgi:hypothetical protein